MGEGPRAVPPITTLSPPGAQGPLTGRPSRRPRARPLPVRRACGFGDGTGGDRASSGAAGALELRDVGGQGGGGDRPRTPTRPGAGRPVPEPLFAAPAPTLLRPLPRLRGSRVCVGGCGGVQPKDSRNPRPRVGGVRGAGASGRGGGRGAGRGPPLGPRSARPDPRPADSTPGRRRLGPAASPVSEGLHGPWGPQGPASTPQGKGPDGGGRGLRWEAPLTPRCLEWR